MIYLTGAINPQTRPLLATGELGALVTPTTGYRVDPSWTWAADNAAFNANTYPGDDAWIAWLAKQPREGCLFATAPDVVGDHDATLTRSLPWLPRIRSLGYPAAFVAQNGATIGNVPWDAFDVLFIGGDDTFKLGGADALIDHAHRIGKDVHVGRVNSGIRYERFALMGVRSCDGTAIAFDPKGRLPEVMSWMRKYLTHQTLF